jgi:hypothetical protein
MGFAVISEIGGEFYGVSANFFILIVEFVFKRLISV